MVSAALALDIAPRHRLGKLGPPGHTLRGHDALMAADGFMPLAITAAHALMVVAFQRPHQYPFHGMLAARAALERLAMVCRDPLMSHFDVEVIW